MNFLDHLRGLIDTNAIFVPRYARVTEYGAARQRPTF